MADAYDRNRRRRRREYGRAYDDDISPTPAPNKPPVVILAKNLGTSGKPSKSKDEESLSSTADTSLNDTLNDCNTQGDKSSVTLLSSSDSKIRGSTSKIQDEGTGSSPHQRSNSNISTNKSQSNDDSHTQSHSHESNSTSIASKRPSSTSSVGNMISGVIDQGAQTQNKLAPPLERQGKIKLIEDFQWCDTGLDLMLDQTDFVVVGIVGQQGCGKSTLLSLLAGNTHQDAYRNYFFYPQTKETKEDCLFQTSGIDMLVTSERVILLDSQALLSAAVMDCQMRYERKIPTEYSSLQNFIEMQSMQILTFMLSVCNIVLVAEDCFTDINFLKFIRDAEMLKPSTQVPLSSDGSSLKEDVNDFYPTVVFVHNKATKEDFKSSTYNLMQHTLNKIFENSKLKIRSNVNMFNRSQGESIMEPLTSRVTNQKANLVNLLMLPVMEFYKSEPEWLQTTHPEYRGYPSFNTLLSFYRAQILSAPRSPLTPSTLTEKNWYHFAARMWETVKKSPLLAEYNRLLS